MHGRRNGVQKVQSMVQYRRLKVGICGELLHHVPDKVGPEFERSRVVLILDGLISRQSNPAAAQVQFTNHAQCLTAGASRLAAKISGTRLETRINGGGVL
jgi:hypothetical protein